MTYKKSYFNTVLCFFLLLAFISNAQSENLAPLVPITLSQDATVFVPEKNLKKKVITKNQQTKLSADFLKLYFAPWKTTFDTKTFVVNQHKVDILKIAKNDLGYFRTTKTWGENFLVHEPLWIDKLDKQMDLSSFPNKMVNAIVVNNTSLRVLPTNNPAFYNLSTAGEGYPFDNLQSSGIWIGTPIHVLHQSLDADWVLVIAPFSYGWLPIEDIAFVDKRFIKKWEKRHYIVPTKDDVPIVDNRKNTYRFKTHIGMLLPEKASRQHYFEVNIPVADQHRHAKLIKARLAKTESAKFPLSADYENMAKMVNQLLGEPYGWGGLHGHRDCSQTLKDYFTLFGIWLPRHSTAQLQKGEIISLLKIPEQEKDQYIIEKGIPYLTLIGKDGHVMLYIGEENNKALVFHNKWGLKTNYPNQAEGRAIIGKSAITDLHLGENLPYTESLMRYALSMNIITNP